MPTQEPRPLQRPPTMVGLPVLQVPFGAEADTAPHATQVQLGDTYWVAVQLILQAGVVSGGVLADLGVVDGGGGPVVVGGTCMARVRVLCVSPCFAMCFGCDAWLTEIHVTF